MLKNLLLCYLVMKLLVMNGSCLFLRVQEKNFFFLKTTNEWK